MKLQIRISRLLQGQVRKVEYFLGPCADDEYIADPREVLRSEKENEITLTVNLPAGTTLEQVCEAVEHFAFRLHEKAVASGSRRKLAAAETAPGKNRGAA